MFSRVPDELETVVHQIKKTFLTTNPVTKTQDFILIPQSVENKLGQVINALPSCNLKFWKTSPYSKDAEHLKFQNLLNKILNKITEQFPSSKNIAWEITLTTEIDFVAHCDFGEKITISRGAISKILTPIAEDKDERFKNLTIEDKLASVIAHEAAQPTNSIPSVYSASIYVLWRKMVSLSMKVATALK